MQIPLLEQISVSIAIPKNICWQTTPKSAKLLPDDNERSNWYAYEHQAFIISLCCNRQLQERDISWVDKKYYNSYLQNDWGRTTSSDSLNDYCKLKVKKSYTRENLRLVDLHQNGWSIPFWEED